MVRQRRIEFGPDNTGSRKTDWRGLRWAAVHPRSQVELHPTTPRRGFVSNAFGGTVGAVADTVDTADTVPGINSPCRGSTPAGVGFEKHFEGA